jgi:pimeloyl-ACP methyl ester carboxylesterase
VDNAFFGWNGAWLDPDFKSWDVSDCLGYIRVPLQIIQGEEDQYGTRRQIEIAEEECYCPVEVCWIPKVGHAPYRESPEITLDAVAGFVDRLLRVHGEGALQPAAGD